MVKLQSKDTIEKIKWKKTNKHFSILIYKTPCLNSGFCVSGFIFWCYSWNQFKFSLMINIFEISFYSFSWFWKLKCICWTKYSHLIEDTPIIIIKLLRKNQSVGNGWIRTDWPGFVWNYRLFLDTWARIKKYSSIWYHVNKFGAKRKLIISLKIDFNLSPEGTNTLLFQMQWTNNKHVL